MIDLGLQPSLKILKQIKLFLLNIIISKSTANMPPPFQNILKDSLSSFKSTGNLTLFLKAKEQYNTYSTMIFDKIHASRIYENGFKKNNMKGISDLF